MESNKIAGVFCSFLTADAPHLSTNRLTYQLINHHATCSRENLPNTDGQQQAAASLSSGAERVLAGGVAVLARRRGSVVAPLPANPPFYPHAAYSEMFSRWAAATSEPVSPSTCRQPV